jgi:glyoxylase-like metal-dependent hydrolase (beta-lactamase superfamily II)
MRLSERCYAVTGLAYKFPPVVNAGFVVGDRETLIVDTGANALAAATIHGYATAVRESNALRVIQTEKHFDHIGGNALFRELGAPIHGHIGIQRTPEEFLEERASFHPGFHYATMPVNPDQVITQDGSLEIGGCRVEILLTPGHTNSNLSVWVPEDRVLYCGDALVNRFPPNLDAADGLANWREWLMSLDRLEALRAGVVVCGHGPVEFGDDIAALFATMRRALAQRIASEGVSRVSGERA